MPPSPDTPVQVLLFARYAELLGADRVEVGVPAGGTVADVIAAVRALPGGQRLPGRLLVARNLEQVSLDVVLRAEDELALLPPMSGG